ncbi:SIS domain-containing protein [Coniochaeta sp. 2T2.1]|nr:SIS domain-containing protein [Coniochaeta sp. 2T2.1]
MVDPRPVQTSAVYLLGPGAAPQFPAIPPPSPPSPVTPEPSHPCTPIEELDLDACTTDSYTQSEAGDYDLQSSNTSFSNEGCLRDTAAPLGDRLASAVHVLSTEAAALSSLSQLYATDALAREAFSRAVEAITRPAPMYHPRGKLVLIGVGKSGHIARKLTATFNSLSVPATFLHPTEALHGDLGVINSRTDTALLITYSGKTPEIIAVLPHLDPDLPLVLLTGAPHHGKNCDVVRLRPDAIVLPSPVHELETTSFGLAAPTTSTTAALAVGDALALVCANELHGGGVIAKATPMSRVATVFARNHPGGAIGAAANNPSSTPSTSTSSAATPRITVRQISTPWKEIPVAHSDNNLTPSCILHLPSSAPATPLLAADILRAGYASPSGWVRVPSFPSSSSSLRSSGGVVLPSRIRSLRSRDLSKRVEDELPGLVVGRADFVSVQADTTAARAREWVRELMVADGDSCRPDSVVCLLEKGEVVGVVEVKVLLDFGGS